LLALIALWRIVVDCSLLDKISGIFCRKITQSDAHEYGLELVVVVVVVVLGERASDSRELCMTSEVPTVSRWLWSQVFSLVHMSAFFFQYYAIKWMLAAPSTAASMELHLQLHACCSMWFAAASGNRVLADPCYVHYYDFNDSCVM
jgi:hypothetical protein